MEFRKDIQILRGIAVLFVVFYHLQLPLFDNGFLGVDIFFVISGFLMAKLYDRGTIMEFYKRRIDRLWPAYAVTIIVTLLIGTVILLPVDFRQLFHQSLWSAPFVSNFYFWSQNSYFSDSEFNPLLNLWSLAVEVQFYLIVPFLYPFLKKRLWLSILLIVGSFAACIIIQSVSPKTSFFMMPLRVWEFLIGAVIAWSFDLRKSPKLSSQSLRSFAIMALILFMVFAVLSPDSRSLMTGHPSFPTLFVCVMTGLIIALGAPQWLENSVIGNCLSKIGDYSYSIYLVHFPLIVLINYEPFGGTILQIEAIQNYALFSILLIVFSYLSYQFIEQRCRKIFNTAIWRLSLVIMIIGGCFVTYFINGGRYTEHENNIFAAVTDRSAYRCGKVFRILNPTKDLCFIGDKNFENIVLLVGDSHADAIKTKFVEVANENNISVLFYVNNNPLVDAQLLSDKVMQDAVENNADLIVLHYNKNKYKKEKFLSEVEKLASSSRNRDIPLSVITPVPTYPSSVPKEIYFVNKEKSNQSFVTLKSRHEEDITKFLSFRPILSKSGVRLFDPAEILCTSEGNCLIMNEDHQPYYFDSHHLTLTGSEKLKTMFSVIVEQAYNH